MLIEEVYINATAGHGIGASGLYEPFTEDPGELYRALQREYGRCIGKVYTQIDGRDGIPVGWVFQGRDKYEDTGEPYLREVWVTLHEAPPTVTREPHYRRLPGRGRV